MIFSRKYAVPMIRVYRIVAGGAVDFWGETRLCPSFTKIIHFTGERGQILDANLILTGREICDFDNTD
jgi:hypothetical protein